MSPPTPPALPPCWQKALQPEIEKPGFRALLDFVAAERAAGPVYPPEGEVFAAFHLTPLDKVKVLILGQDPYHGPGQAHGLAFSVRPGVQPPPSLANMFKELAADLGCAAPRRGSLVPWAQQGVLLLNAVLTVRGGQSTSHQGKGWEKFTDGVIKALSAREEPMVFVLWGGYARKKAKLIDQSRHKLIEGIHPSPLSAHQGFFGSKPFSKINAALAALGHGPIEWPLPDRTNLTAHEEGPLPCLCRRCLRGDVTTAEKDGMAFQREEVRLGRRSLYFWMPEALGGDAEAVREAVKVAMAARHGWPEEGPAGDDSDDSEEEE